jgi:phosphoribosylformylglycinamidine synthase subunit PurQ / glutaminase
METPPKIIVLAGYGLNCEEETALAFNLAGGEADIVHINDLIDNPKQLLRYQILAIPGGFSYGDDLGSGRAYANKLNNHLKKHLAEFASKDKLIIGICNGFQILTNLGLLPGVLTFNDNNRYTDRWVDLKIKSNSPWLSGIKTLSVPIAHGEGKFVAADTILTGLQKQKMLAGVYYEGEICKYQGLKPNPNGSTLDIAIITSENGKILGTMPHPERAMFFTQSPNWPLLKEKMIRSGKKLPKYGPGLQIFKNAVNYFL